MNRTVPPIAPRLAAALLVAGLGACGPAPAPAPAAEVAAPPAPGDSGYAPPPELTGAARLDQRLVLSGTAVAGAQVVLASPTGPGASGAADAKGAWSIAIPAPGAEPAMYALSTRAADRVIRAEGAVLLLPRPGPPAVLARAGTAALPLEGPSASLRIVALDYDAGGGAAVAGVGPALARVRLSIDGVEAGLDQADARGRFAILGANRPLQPGARRLVVEMDGGAHAEAVAVVAPAAPLGQAAFRAVRQGAGWRVDWARAGGGLQSTLVFDAPEGAAP